MLTPQEIADAFDRLDFHDETLVGVRVLPALTRDDESKADLEIQLTQYGTNTLTIIRFSRCANLRMIMDFDVLAGNLPSNTSGLNADTSTNRIRELMQSQKKDLGVDYIGTAICPLTKKLAAIDELVFFRVQFCGGIVEVIARECQVESVNQPVELR